MPFSAYRVIPNTDPVKMGLVFSAESTDETPQEIAPSLPV